MNIYSKTITQLHEECIIHWYAQGVILSQTDFYRLVEENHAFNYQLWLAEDKARRDDLGSEFVYHAKRSIDHYNQQRNNRMEAMDSWLYQTLQPALPDQCPVHSESPGMMIDRLSILALKSYHMDLQTKRRDVTQEHTQTCGQKLNVIRHQLDQLAACLHDLLREIQEKTRTFRIYHQFKMYNDPHLNPELYRVSAKEEK